MSKNFFEGWYYKLVSFDENTVIAFIPGISYTNNKQDNHCFIQIINGSSNKTEYLKYPINKFNKLFNVDNIKIDNNIFSKHGIKLNIQSNKINVKGNVYFNNMLPLEKSFLSPGAMGYFGYFPFMECFHEVISMSNDLKGSLKINNELINFDNGKGYIEKDWGKSFPQNWIWIQSNHFSDPTATIMCSIAKVPFLTLNFDGFICILNVRGTEYRFATYNNSKIKKLIIFENEICIELKNKNYTLQITALRKKGGSLRAPIQGNMKRIIVESLNSIVKVKLKNNKGITIFSDIGKNTGLEICH